MRRSFLWLLLTGAVLALLLAGCSDQSSQVTGPQQQSSTQTSQVGGRAPLLPKVTGGNYIEGSYIVVFKDAVADVDNEVNDIAQKHAVKANYTYKYALKGFAGKLTAAQLEALQNDSRIAYIEQDQIAHIFATQTNPPSWGLDRIDQRNLPLDALYTYNQTGTGVVAYCIDTGIRQSHTDFGGRAVFGFDAIINGGTANDDNGHGTHTAGTIGGAAYGVAKNIKLVAVKVLNSAGSGSYSQVIAGINWATSDHSAHPGPAVANMSLGGPVDAGLDQAVRNSIAGGIVYCVAAGNSSADASTQSPADVTEAVTVAATDISDGFASFSNFGSVVDIAAPGVNITSDWNTSNTATNTISGTSMATPHVCGAAALYLEANPSATPAAVQSALKSNGTSNVISGVPAGTVNLLLYSVVAGGPPPPPPPAPTLSSPANGATGVSIPATLSWNASSGASSYRVQVSTASDFSTLTYDQSGITSTSTSVSGLAANTLYYWRVNASNAGGTSAWSATWSFTTGSVAPPAAPTLSSPATGSTNVSRTPTLSWNASSGAASYRVQVSTDAGFTTPVFDQSGITSTSTTVSGLAGRTTYYWRVNASNSGGTSAWSAVWNFRTRKN